MVFLSKLSGTFIETDSELSNSVEILFLIFLLYLVIYSLGFVYLISVMLFTFTFSSLYISPFSLK